MGPGMKTLSAQQVTLRRGLQNDREKQVEVLQ